MPFSPIKFLGVSVMSFTSSIGWGSGSTSTLTIQLVADPLDHDNFTATDATIGQPVYFQYGSFNFAGLLQKFERKLGPDGYPVYEVVVVDPREVLETGQLILSSFNGSVGSVKNVINVFGWWENTVGFGASSVNESGMPWYKIRDGLNSIVSNPMGSPYGGPLTFRGFQYNVDLSELPNPPQFYRIGGVTTGLMEAISSVCEDGGCDFFVELKGTTIKVRTVSRFNQPPLGTISRLATTNGTDVMRAQSGLELRNETTAAFLIGGEVTSLLQTDALTQFWGYDVEGFPIIGEQGSVVLKNKAGDVIKIVDAEQMLLNASPVADVIGALRYQCTTLEMRLSLVNYDSWAAFVSTYRPDIAKFVVAPMQNQAVQAIIKPDVVNDLKADVLKMQAGLQDEFWSKTTRLYEFVKSYASGYMGKKYLVAIPFVLQKQDDETLKVSYSQEPTDAGWLPDGSTPLGLSDLNQDVFKAQDGRFQCFVEFDNIFGVDMTHINPADTVIEANNLFMRATIAPQIIFTDTTPAVLMTLGETLYDESLDVLGDLSIVEAVLQLDPGEGKKALLNNAQFGNVGIKVFPAARSPNLAAVPLKSNVLTYGPWSAQGAAGKVKVEYDPSLTPWNYGGFDVMNQTGDARVKTTITNQQVSEAGTLELVGAPTASLGDIMQSGGPNVTNIDVSIGKDGVTSTYRFATFTPKFGVFSKQNIERFKKIGLTNQELKKSMKIALKEQQLQNDVAANAVIGFLQNAPKAVKRESPYDVFVSRPVQDDSGNIRVGLSAATYEEAVGLTRAEDDNAFQSTAVMSLTGLFRPFSTAASGVLMSAYTTPSGVFDTPDAINKNTYDPWNSSDVEILAWGDTYTGLHAFRRGADAHNTRAIALRGPLVVSGWGWTVDGRKVPDNGEGEFADNYRRRSDLWATGPVDLLWDSQRGVWTCHDVLVGVLSDDLPANGESEMDVSDGTHGTGMKVSVSNWFNSSVGSGTNVIANYCVTANKWYIVAADCDD